MSDIQRWILILGVACLLGPAAVFFALAATDAKFVYRFTMSRSHDNPIQKYLSQAKWLLVAMAGSLLLSLTSTLFPLEWRTLGFSIFFLISCGLMVGAAFCMWRGYHIWRTGIEG